MISLFGIIGAFFMTLSALPQAWHSYKEGNSKGVSGYLIVFLFIGLIGCILYDFGTRGFDVILFSKNFLNGLLWGIIAYYKWFPRT